MATEDPLAGGVDGCLMDIRLLIRNARADGRIEHHEAERVFAVIDTTLFPQVALLTTTVDVIKSMLSSADGCRGNRVQRKLKTIWQRPANVIDFRGRDEEDPSAA